MPEVEGGESSDDIYPFHGVDGENNPIGPCDAFWKRVLTKKIRKDVDDDENTKEGKHLWYHQGVEYWNHVDATVDGVLGGFGSVSGADAKENERILRTMMYPEGEFSEILEKRALDVGAGVGRVSVRDFVCVIVFSFRRRLQVVLPFVCAHISSSRLTFSLFTTDANRARS
jgi:hypothetical protein